MKYLLPLLFLFSCSILEYQPDTKLVVKNKTSEQIILKITKGAKEDRFFIPREKKFFLFNFRTKAVIPLKEGTVIIENENYRKQLIIRTGVEYRKTFD